MSYDCWSFHRNITSFRRNILVNFEFSEELHKIRHEEINNKNFVIALQYDNTVRNTVRNWGNIMFKQNSTQVFREKNLNYVHFYVKFCYSVHLEFLLKI
jgi:hypothetical protein